MKLFSLLAGLLWLAHKGTVKSLLVNNWRLTGTRLISWLLHCLSIWVLITWATRIWIFGAEWKLTATLSPEWVSACPRTHKGTTTSPGVRFGPQRFGKTMLVSGDIVTGIWEIPETNRIFQEMVLIFQLVHYSSLEQIWTDPESLSIKLLYSRERNSAQNGSI